MPLYDRKCSLCGLEQLDRYEPSYKAPNPICACGGELERLWSVGAVIGDECDVTVKHGLCWPDGSPRRYRSHTEIKAEAKKRGLENRVEHIGERGSDRSKHTSKWV